MAPIPDKFNSSCISLKMSDSKKKLDSGVLTIATGAAEYKEMARSLALSLKRFSPNLTLAVVTDDDTLRDCFDVIVPVDWTRGKGVLQKMYLDLYTPFRCTLFIDCDCLVFRDISYIFDIFSGGYSIVPTDVYELSSRHPRDIDFRKMQSKISQPWIYGFNGGAYYIERDTDSQKIFERGRDIAKVFREYGIPDFRDGEPNDEYLLATAMAELKAPVIPCWHQLLQIPLGLEGKFDIDVALGKANFEIYGKNSRPAIVHFCGYFREWPEYKRECLKLKTLHSSGGSLFRARLTSILFYGRQFGDRAYRYIPRPLRMLWQGFKSRLKKRNR
jgi:hypothetical protein